MHCRVATLRFSELIRPHSSIWARRLYNVPLLSHSLYFYSGNPLRGTGNIEAEALNGDVVKLGRSLGVKTPYNETLWRVAEEMARKREKPGKYTVEDLMRMVND